MSDTQWVWLRGLWQIVAQKNLDANALLVRHDRLSQAMCQQDACCRPRFVAGILTDDGIDRAVQQEPAGVLGQFMGDPDDIAGPAGALQCRGNTPIAGTGAVDAEQIGMPLQELGRQHPGAFAVVAPFERRQCHEIGIFAGQDLMESELAFGMIAQRQ